MKKYDQHGFCFEYPDTWTVCIEDGSSGDTVNVYSAGAGFWTLSRYPAIYEPEQLISEALNALKQEYPDCETSRTHNTVEGFSLSGAEVDFFYLDMPSLAIIYSIRIASNSYIIYAQMMENESEENTREIFRALTQSWLKELKTQFL